jgi:hypothetical protein
MIRLRALQRNRLGHIQWVALSKSPGGPTGPPLACPAEVPINHHRAVCDAKITADRPFVQLARAFLKQRTGPGYLLFHLVQQHLGSSNSRRREAFGKLIIYRGEH